MMLFWQNHKEQYEVDPDAFEDIADYTLFSSTLLTGVTSAPNAFWFDGAGEQLFTILDHVAPSDTVYRRTLSTPWLASSVSAASVSSIGPFTNMRAGQASHVSPNGEYFIYGGDGGWTGDIRVHTLSTPNDLSTEAFWKVFTPGGSIFKDMKYEDEGSKLFLVLGSALREFTLPAPYDTDTAVLTSTSPGSIFSNKNDRFSFFPGGTRLFSTDANDPRFVYQFNTGSAWSAVGMSYEKSKEFTDFSAATQGAIIGPSGQLFRLEGSGSTRYLNEYRV